MSGVRAQPSRVERASEHTAAHSALALLGFLLASLTVAVVGGALSVTAIDGWYDDLVKPMWTPPNAVFGPVWTVLYASMAIAAWLVWRHPPSTARRRALTVYAVQLALNSLWTPAFFALGSAIGASGLWIALGLIVALDVAILATMIRFSEVSKPAAVLIAPYWLWVLFATTLNAAIAVLAV